MTERTIYQFGDFRLDASSRMLFRGTIPVPLPPKAVDTLLILVESSGVVVAKSDIMKRVWKEAFVEEGSLTRTVSLLRKALGEKEHEFIATVSKRGYRFAAPVTRLTETQVPEPADRAVLIVLPFENLSGDPAQEFFSDGLTEELITQLSRLNPARLAVIARATSMKFKGANKSIREIAREVGVTHILEGSVRREVGRVRVTAQLIQAGDETHLWAESFERNVDDILIVQSEVSQAVAAQVQVKLSPVEEKRLAGVSLVRPAAHEAYLKGRYLWNKRTEESMRKSIAYYEEAIQQDSKYAAAYAGIADSYVMLACRGMAPAKETFRKAKDAATKAIGLDPSVGEAFGSLAHVRLHDWDWEELERDFQRAIELNPAHGIVYYWYGEFLMSLGRPNEAIAVTQRAYEADPLSAIIGASLGMILYLARRYDQAIAVLEHVQDITPEHFLPHMRMGLAYIQTKQFGHALAELKLAVQLANESTESLSALAMGYAASANRKDAEAIIRKLREIQGTRYVLPYNVAKIYAALCDKESCLAWLDRAYNEGNPDLIELNSEPLFDAIRKETRFSSLMDKVGLKDYLHLG